MFFWEMLMVAALWAAVCKGEQRKLVPKCVNACLTGPQPPTNCGCDSRCSLEFNDCCLDAPYRSPATRRRHGLQCVFVAGENDHFWMVRACAEGWQGSTHVRERCERRGGAVVSGRTSDAAGERPFTDASGGGGLTYRNLYCALCNNVSAEQLLAWRLKALCAEGVAQTQVLANLTWEEDAAQWRVAGRPCHLLFERPPAAPVRRCLGSAVSACPPTWRGSMATRRRCRSYVDPVRWGDGPLFRNIDCALCHGHNTTGFECHYEVTREVSALVLERAMDVDVERMGQWF